MVVDVRDRSPTHISTDFSKTLQLWVQTERQQPGDLPLFCGSETSCPPQLRRALGTSATSSHCVPGHPWPLLLPCSLGFCCPRLARVLSNFLPQAFRGFLVSAALEAPWPPRHHPRISVPGTLLGPPTGLLHHPLSRGQGLPPLVSQVPGSGGGRTQVAWTPSAVGLNGLSCPSFPPEWGLAGGMGREAGPGQFLFIFLMWTILKVFIEFVTVLLLFYVVFARGACGILAP